MLCLLLFWIMCSRVRRLVVFCRVTLFCLVSLNLFGLASHGLSLPLLAVGLCPLIYYSFPLLVCLFLLL